MTAFKGGLHPPYYKEATREREIRPAALPKLVRLPLQQHIGAPAKSVVEVGQHVKRGQLIAEAGGYVSAAVHASVSGKVTAIRPLPHPFGSKLPAIEIESDTWDTPLEETVSIGDVESLTPDQIIEAVHRAGIVGMGGAAFPTHVKLKPPKGVTIHTLILNGAECEPYLTCDFRVMIERPDDVVAGARLLQKAVSAKRIVIGIEANKEEAIETMSEAAGDFSDIAVESVEVKYPQGSELQLIKALAGIELPKSKLPLEAGFVVQNVVTALAVFEAVTKGKPLYERVVTVSGDGVKEPGNFLVRLGTSFGELLEQAGAVAEDAAKVIMGGPMMGLAQHTYEVPVIKGTSGIVVFREEEVEIAEALACIRCARCETRCPAGLATARIGLAAEFGKFEIAEALKVMECIECGCCSYVCPSKRPMTHYMKAAKAEIMRKRQREKAASGE
ncbi:MAG: electron transport complex subunit RsxC [bacterium]|nr:electron transport complex subunit RsxC [bacterium]